MMLKRCLYKTSYEQARTEFFHLYLIYVLFIIICTCLSVQFMLHDVKLASMCQVLLASVELRVQQVAREYLDLRDYLAPQAVVDILVYLEVPGYKEIQEVQVHRVPSVLLVDQVIIISSLFMILTFTRLRIRCNKIINE